MLTTRTKAQKQFTEQLLEKKLEQINLTTNDTCNSGIGLNNILIGTAIHIQKYKTDKNFAKLGVLINQNCG